MLELKYSTIEKILVVCLLVGLLGFLLIEDLNTPEWSDETVVARLAKNFPDYSLSSDWIKNYPFYSTASKDLIELEYTMPVWHHPPLPIVILAPLARLTTNIYILRVVTILCFLGAIILVYLSIKKTTKRALVCLFPILLFSTLFRGAIYLYHDAFMVFFFALSWYLVVNHSKWKYVAACLLVLTKTQAFLFLVPLIIKDWNWKLGLPGLAILPWFIWGAVANQNLFWVMSHWSTLMTTAFPEWGPVFGRGVFSHLMAQGLPIYLGLTLPVLFIIRKFYAEVCLLVVALGMYYAWLCIDYHFLSMVIVLPIIMATWIDRIPYKSGLRLIKVV